MGNSPPSSVTSSDRAHNSDTAVIIPVYNEAAVIGDVVAGVLEHFPYVVCVDDGSTDESAVILSKTNVRLVRHPINVGQGAALQTGIEYALLDPQIRYLVTYDADGQHRLEDALSLVQLLRDDGLDIVFGSRFLDQRTQMSVLKRIVLRTAVAYTNVTSGIHLTDAHNGLRAFTVDVGRQLHLRQSGMAHASEIIERVADRKFRFKEAPVEILYTDYSRSKGQSVLNSVNILFDLLFR